MTATPHLVLGNYTLELAVKNAASVDREIV
jgi:hypothetical protein